jgi:hypothetical protein
MLLDCSYEQAFKKVFPCTKKIPSQYYDWPKSGYKLTPEKALRILNRCGVKTKKAKLKKVQSLKKRTALIMLRWREMPELMHAMVFDPDDRTLLDPSSYTSVKLCNENLEAIYYVKLPKKANKPKPETKPMKPLFDYNFGFIW